MSQLATRLPRPGFGTGALLVAGGTGGIGQAITAGAARAGAKVVFTYRTNAQRAASLCEQLRQEGCDVHARALELNDRNAIICLLDDLRRDFDRLDGVIYAAGPPVHLDFVSRLPANSWRTAFESDAEACFNLVQCALPILHSQRGGSLTAVTTSQVTRSEITGVLSAAPKAAIEMLFRAVAKESAKFGVRANTVQAGWVNAGMTDGHLNQQLSEQAWSAIRARIPMQRMARPEEIAAAVLFLASADASYVTGSSLTVDGGVHL